MAIFIPALLETEPDILMTQIARLELLVKRIQIDFADGIFVPTRSVLPNELDRLASDLELDAHLMVERPADWLPDLARLGFRRAIIHIESQGSSAELLALAQALDLVIAWTLNPDSQLTELVPLADEAEFLQIMTVEPGLGGQRLEPLGYDRLAEAKSLFPGKAMAVDGGVRLDNAAGLIALGADLLIVGQAGWSATTGSQPLADGLAAWRSLVS